MYASVDFQVLQCEIINEESAKIAERTEAAAQGKCIVPKWVPIVIVVVLILTVIGAVLAMGFAITTPRTSTKALKLYNDSCAVLSRECDDSRGLYCPVGRCVCELTGSYYNGSRCVCGNATLSTSQACIDYPTYGESCSLPSIPCLPSFVCASSGYCDCNLTTQFYNGFSCVTQYTFNHSCTRTAHCANTTNLECITNRCSCPTDSYWNGTACAPKILGWYRCNNLTSGFSALPCDNTLSLLCHSNFTCQCPNTMFWNINDQICEIKRFYGDECNGDFYCNETLNFICPTTPGTCNCPVLSNDYNCDCQPNWFYDGFQCTPRKSINGTCLGTHACDRNTLLVCFTGLCLCPTPTAWNGINCVCPTGQTWTGSTCVVVG